MFDSFAIPWTVTHQAHLSMGFPRQEYLSGLPFSSPGDLPDPEIKPTSLALASRFFTTEPPGKPKNVLLTHKNTFVCKWTVELTSAETDGSITCKKHEEFSYMGTGMASGHEHQAAVRSTLASADWQLNRA